MTDKPTTVAHTDKLAAYRHVRTGLRSDLQITRQLTKGEPAYVLFDPVSFQSHRLSLNDYRVAACLDESQTLEQAFQRSIAEQHLSLDDEADFFQFISRLESLGLLSVSNHNGQAHFNRFKQKSAESKKAQLLGFLFLTIPIYNPDKFLGRTVNRVRFLFSSTALVLWSVLMCAALALVINKWSAFIQPLNGLLAVKNLLFMSLAFVALKVWHELGHGYACKHFGGRVPEMGCKLMAGMPLAYVDASSAWSFPKRSQRIVVMLGGMYFESLVAIPATFIWAFAPDSFVGACAYQLIFMAGVATVFFNANPLMKYDGYFVLSDVLGIPNLRARAKRETLQVLKTHVVGIKIAASPATRSERITLLSYGILSTIYTTFLMISIPLMLASRFQVLGLVLGIFQLGMPLFVIPKKLFMYLLQADETAPVRVRARRVAYGLAGGIPLILLCFPIPTGLLIDGVVSAERATVLRAKTPGIIQTIMCSASHDVVADQPLLIIANTDARLASQTGAMAAAASQRHARFISRQDVTEGAKVQAAATERQINAEAMQLTDAELTVCAPHGGRLSYIVPTRALGSYVFTGDPIAKLVSGKTIVRAWLDDGELYAARLKLGSSVNVRMADRAAKNFRGTIISVAPASATEFADLSLTTAGEGDVLLDPLNGATTRALFQLQISVPSLNSELAHQEARAFVLVGRKYEPIGAWIVRHTRKFITSIFTN